MGRADAVAFNLAVAAEAKRLEPRLVIEYLPGWESRGNGTSANYEGAVVHHTASNSTDANPFPTKSVLLNGRPGLTGPLCNWAGPRCTVEAPRLVVVAAFPANHAGASGGKSMGPLPVTNLFNPRVLGLEIDYAGNSPMTAGQYRAAVIWSRAVSNVLGRSAEYIRAHAETSITGKWDPGTGPGQTLNMADFRRDVAAFNPSASPVTPPESAMSFRISVTPNGTCWFITPVDVIATGNIYRVGALAKQYGVPVTPATNEEVRDAAGDAAEREARIHARLIKLLPVPNVAVEEIVNKLMEEFEERAATAPQLSDEQIRSLIDDIAIETTRLAAERLAG